MLDVSYLSVVHSDRKIYFGLAINSFAIYYLFNNKVSTCALSDLFSRFASKYFISNSITQ